MVQVRCPECGYLQSLSEERFLSISEDFLNCPHCNARVPKQWGPCNTEHVPDEARHKISAFSSRILNGGVIAKEVAHALESLVRRYGPYESSYKALGIGYTKLGDFKKAEEFLNSSKEHDGPDVDVEKHLLETLVGLERYEEAQATGFRLIENGEAAGDDVARTAISLINLGEVDEANDLLKSYPVIDTHSSAAKLLKRQLSKATGTNFSAKLKEKVNLKRLMGDTGKDGLKSLADRALSLFSLGDDAWSDGARSSSDVVAEAVSPESGSKKGADPSVIQPRIEYWIYSPSPDIPRWEDVKRSFGDAISSMPARARAFELLESLLASHDLNIEYMLRSEAEELFDYPQELIRLNSRNFTDDDLELLGRSQLIVRMELTPTSSWGPESLKFITGFVEGLRNLTNGLVQDAISHTLWGLEAWAEFSAKPLKDVPGDHLHLDLLDEDGTIWMHTHGMLKFGLPDLEIDGIPSNLKKHGQELLLASAGDLIMRKGLGRALTGEFPVLDGALMVDYRYNEPDEEGHFPDGVFKLRPCAYGDNPERPEALADALRLMESGFETERSADVPKTGQHLKARWVNPPVRTVDPRELLIQAHRKARERLDDFRKSFRDNDKDSDQVHAVKVGFPSPDGRYEWMWISLAQWENGRVSGRLENSPVVRKDLYKGCPVEIDESDIFDWVISSDGEIVNGAFTEPSRH